MINRNNKKGFTIVELVIVIAVIAILAAVLIPTFSGIVKKANLSADQQAVRQMNTALAMYEAENGKIEDLITAKKALDEALVNVEGGLVPVTQGYAFYWDKANNEVVLVGEGTTIEDTYVLLSNNGFGEKSEVATVDELTAAIAASSNEKPAIIKLTADVTLEADLTIGSDKAVTLDLNNKSIVGTDKNLKVENGGTLTVKNGTIDVMNLANLNSYLLLDDVTTMGTNTYVFIRGFSDTSIINSKLNTISTNSSDAASDGARISIVDTEIVKSGSTGAGIMISIVADVTIDNCKITGNSHAMVLHCSTAKITNTTFTSKLEEFGCEETVGSGNACPAAAVAVMAHGADAGYGDNGNYTFENCTFNSAATSGTQVFVYSADSNCKLVVNGIGDAKVNNTVTGAGSITVNGEKVQ